MIHFSKLINYTSTHTGKQNYKDTLLVNFVSTAFFFFIAYSIINFSIHHISGGFGMLISGLAELLIVYLFIKGRLKYKVAANIGILIGVFLLFIEIYFTDGIYSPTLPWLISPPIISFLLLEKGKNSKLWVLICVSLIAFFGIAESQGIGLSNKIHSVYIPLVTVTSNIGLVLFLIIVSKIFETKNQLLFDELESKQIQLLESEKRFRTMFEKAPLGIGLTNSKTGVISKMNTRYAEIVGYCDKDIKGLDWMSMTHPDDIQEDLNNMVKMNAGEISGFKITKRYIRPDKSIVWVDVAIATINTEDKANPYHLCMIEDITEKREAEVIVRNREMLMQQNVLLELSLIPTEMPLNDKIRQILIKAAEALNCEFTSFWTVNEEVISTEYFYKRSSNDFIEGNSYLITECPVFFNELEKHTNIVVNDTLSNPSTFEFIKYFKRLNVASLLDITLKKGNDLIGIFSFEHVETPRNWLRAEEVFARSISDFVILAFESEALKRTQEKLKINKERWKFAIQGSNDGLWDWNVATSEVYRSKRWYEILGFKITEVSSNVKEWFTRIHPEDFQIVSLELKNHFNSITDSYVTEHRVLCKDGTYKWILDRGKIIARDEAGIALRIVGTTTDISKRKNAEEALFQTNEKLQAIFSGSNDAILLLTEKGFFDCNPIALEIFNIADISELKRLHPSDISPEFQPDGRNSLEKSIEMIQLAFENGMNRFEWLHKRKGGENFYAEVLLSAFNYGGQRVLQSTVRDITHRKAIEYSLERSEEKYRSLIENSPEIILMTDRNEIIEFSNFASTRYKSDEIINHSLYEFLDERHHKEVKLAHQSIFNGSKSVSYETEGTSVNETKTWFLTHVGPKYFDNNVVGLVLFIKNITDRKIDEERIKQSLHEKEVLLKEVHHRVKNNLQIISSILNLQSSTITDQLTLDLLRNSQDRIRSMSLIHELLYQTKDFSTINFSEYIRSISTNLFQSYNQNKNIVLVLEVDELFLDLDLAIPCGLIINELITNSLKYAFEIQGDGEVKICLSQTDNDVLLKIEDNGKGFPSTIDFRDTESLGMQLVVSLIDQIDGKIELENLKGAKYKLSFKNGEGGKERLN